MDTKLAKDFLVQQIADQAALEGVHLTEIEKRMMYFTESDSDSCDKSIELEREFEGQYDRWKYDIKISRLLHHAYRRLKKEDAESVRYWDLAIRTLRRGDDYFYLLTLWDIHPPSEHPIRRFFKVLGVMILVTTGIMTAAFLAAKYDIGSERYRIYLTVVVIGLALLALRAFRLVYRQLFIWFHRHARR